MSETIEKVTEENISVGDILVLQGNKYKIEKIITHGYSLNVDVSNIRTEEPHRNIGLDIFEGLIKAKITSWRDRLK